MPFVRWFLENTVLGDPDMRPIAELEQLGVPLDIEELRGGLYFIASVTKPGGRGDH